MKSNSQHLCCETFTKPHTSSSEKKMVFKIDQHPNKTLVISHEDRPRHISGIGLERGPRTSVTKVVREVDSPMDYAKHTSTRQVRLLGMPHSEGVGMQAGNPPRSFSSLIALHTVWLKHSNVYF